MQDQQVADASGRRLGNSIAVNSLCIGRSSGSQRIGSNEAEAVGQREVEVEAKA